MGVNEFLERVEKLGVARGVTKPELSCSAIELLEGKALVWHRSVRRTLTDWEDICVKIKEEFLPIDYCEKLWEAIKRRTQGETESVGVYLSTMNNLFGRMTCNVPEEMRLKILKRNLLPFYQQQIGLTEITSEEHLKLVCKRIEANWDSMSNLVPPKKINTDIDTNLVYPFSSSSRH